MNWDNETVLKFLELYQCNSCIWDPQHESHKNRQRVNDAWNNIKENLGVACTIKDLKKKKESLMSAYRNYKNKIRNSEKSGSGSSEVYQPTWFAFSIMDGFLGSVYTCNTTKSTEDEDLTVEDTDTTNTIGTDEINEPNPTTSNQESPSINPTPPVRRRQKNPPELIEAKKHMEQAFHFIKQISEEQRHPKNEDDECTVFGQLIARKIRKLSDERRDVMMVKINQLFVDEHMLHTPGRLYSTSTMSSYTPSPPHFQEDYSHQSPSQIGPTVDCNTITVDPIQTEEASPTVDCNTITVDPIQTEEASPTVDDSSLPTRSYSTREYIIPNIIYDGSADVLKDFIIFKEK